MRVLVAGKHGQLAKSLAARSANHSNLLCSFAGRPELDLTNQESLETAISNHRPDVIINAAAYTQVDKAEEETSEAFVLNAEGPGHIAALAQSIGARVIHVSTDYVFDGTKAAPYVEADAVNPQSVYGKSKLAGELAITGAGAHYVILRTAWVYSPYGNNFVKSILSAAQRQNQLRVVDDQIGNPTCAYDLADAILVVLKSWQSGGNEGVGEVFHCAGSGQTSWYGLARHILEASKKIGGPFAEVKAIPGSQWPTPAKRPSNSVLDSSRFIGTFGFRLPEWQDSVSQTVGEILRKPVSESAI